MGDTLAPNGFSALHARLVVAEAQVVVHETDQPDLVGASGGRDARPWSRSGGQAGVAGLKRACRLALGDRLRPTTSETFMSDFGTEATTRMA